MFKRKPSKGPAIDTLIGAKTRINGNVEFSGRLHLEGSINGDIYAPDGGGYLSVAASGAIEGSVIVADIVLHGVVRGDIDATGRVELGENAHVLGNVRYAVIESAVGAQISGKLIHRPNASGGGAVSQPSPDPEL